MAEEADWKRGVYEGSARHRVLWWLGVYFGLQLPLIGFIPYFWVFPLGLNYWLIPRPTLSAMQDGPLGIWYLCYLVHLCFSLFVPSKRAFRILMVLLVLLVALNVVGCMETDPHLTADDLH